MLRKRLERWERWLRAQFRSRKTRRIDDEQQKYLRTYHDVQEFLTRLHARTDQQTNVVIELKKRMGINDST